MTSRKCFWFVVGTIVVGTIAGWYVSPAVTGGREHVIDIVARQYEFEPSQIYVNKGDTLRLKFRSEDVVHGFFLEGHDVNLSILPGQEVVQLKTSGGHDGPPEFAREVVVEAKRVGKFRFRCSVTCGNLHPFMQGKLVVGSNRVLHAGVGMILGLAAAMLFIGLKWRGSDET